MAAVIPDSVEKGNPDDKLVLYGFGSVSDMAGSASPFVGKVEAFLRMNDIPYEVEVGPENIKKSPKKMVPFIQHGDVCLADSYFIIEYLSNTYADKLKVKTHTDSFKNGIAINTARACENNLLAGVLWHRWTTDEGFAAIKPLYFKDLPFPQNIFLPGNFRKQRIRMCMEKGFGKHSRKDIMKILTKTMDGIAGVLGKNKYITGNKPCPEDCTVYAVLDNYLNSKVIENDPLRELVLKYDNLVAYVKNMEKELYPEDNPSKFKASKQ